MNLKKKKGKNAFEFWQFEGVLDPKKAKQFFSESTNFFLQVQIELISCEKNL